MATDEPTDKAGDELLAQVYDQLRAIARHRIASEAPGHTLQATALVHEAWMKLCQNQSVKSLDRTHFVLTAAEAMRRVLIDHARTRKRLKRGGANAKQATIDIEHVAELADHSDPDQIMALDDAIRRFEEEDPSAAQVVRLRFFAGLSVEETAQCLGISERTVKRDWQFARAWLFRALE